MKIRFVKGDPREGMEVEFDSSRGQELIDDGSAVEVKAGVVEEKPEPKKTGKKKPNASADD